MNRPPTQKRPRVTLDAILGAAIRIADADGLAAVTMRRVAAELNTATMNLYQHVADKDQLVSLMTDEVVRETLVTRPLPEDWREAIGMIARQMHAALVAHPWSIPAFVHRPRLGADVVRQLKQMARATAGLAVEPMVVWRARAAVNAYVLGQALRSMTVTTDPDAYEEEFDPSDFVEFPELAELPKLLRRHSPAERFEFGLEIVLDGIEHRLA